MKTQRHPSTAPLVIACAVMAMSAAGCSRSGDQTAANTTGPAAPLAALPLTTNDNGQVNLAPALTALKPAPPARVTRLVDPHQSYAYLDRAYASAQTYGDAPPDYTYDYDGTHPWVWRSDDGSERLAERTPDGLRYYYYEAGAQYPYLVQDPDYTYGYSDGELVAVYHDGALLSYQDAQRRADIAGRYLARARALYHASLNQQRLAVQQAHWEAERAQVAANEARWAQEQSRYADWRAYHQAHAQDYQDHFAGEQYRRDSEAARYAQSVNDPAAAARAMQAARQAQAAAHRPGQDIGPPPAALPAQARAPSPSPIGRAGPGDFGHVQATQMQAQRPAVSQGPNDATRAPVNAHAQQAADRRAQQDQERARAESVQQDAAKQAQAQAQASAQARARGEAARQASVQAAASARAQHAAAMQAQEDQARAHAAAQQAVARQAQVQAEAQAAAAHQAQAAAANAERARQAAAAHAQPAAKPDRPRPAGAETPRVGEDKHP